MGLFRWPAPGRAFCRIPSSRAPTQPLPESRRKFLGARPSPPHQANHPLEAAPSLLDRARRGTYECRPKPKCSLPSLPSIANRPLRSRHEAAGPSLSASSRDKHRPGGPLAGTSGKTARQPERKYGPGTDPRALRPSGPGSPRAAPKRKGNMGDDKAGPASLKEGLSIELQGGRV